MRNLKYVSDSGEFTPNFDAVVILSRFNGARLYEDSTWELHPVKAICFESKEVAEYFVKNFEIGMEYYDEAMPVGTVYHTIDTYRLAKGRDNYADRLVSKDRS